MPLPRLNKAVAGLQKKYRLSRIFEDIFETDNPLHQYGGYYDIAVRDGATSLAGVEATNQGDPIGTLKQHVPAASGDDIQFTTIAGMSDPATAPLLEMAYRKEITYSTGTTIGDKPLMFYPENHFIGLFVDDGQGGKVAAEGANIGDFLRVPLGSFNIPVETVIEEYSFIFLGANLLFEIGIDQSDIESMDTGGGVSPLTAFPVPQEPGVLAITVKVDPVTRIPDVNVYVDGVDKTGEVGTGGLAPTDPVPEGEGIDLDEALMYLTMPCWGTQKMLIISRKLTEEEVVKITDRMNRTAITRR